MNDGAGISTPFPGDAIVLASPHYDAEVALSSQNLHSVTSKTTSMHSSPKVAQNSVVQSSTSTHYSCESLPYVESQSSVYQIKELEQLQSRIYAILIILSVSAIWVAASYLMKELIHAFDRPVTLTYIFVSSLQIFFVFLLIKDRINGHGNKSSKVYCLTELSYLLIKFNY